MKLNYYIILAFIGLIVLHSTAQSIEKPNVIVILSDDQGWADVGFNGSKDIPTPNLDALAKSGVIFSQGYASHPYCSPSRAGLLTGRYQQRFGHENNIPHNRIEENSGLPLDELMLSEILKQNGYQTCAIGKWHLGDHEKFWPNNRGFTDWYGFVSGSRTFWANNTNSKRAEIDAIRRDGKKVPLDEISYLTDDFTNEAINYVEKYNSKRQPYFMYLAYNAPHAPIQATSQYVKMVDHIEDGRRAAYAAMVTGMDHGIGKLIEKLKATGTYENTLIFFYSDNGGSTKFGSRNYPYRGSKGMMFEGGIRIPFLVSWPSTIKSGLTYDKPITALDIYPTILKATGIKYNGSKKLDGVNLLPYLDGSKTDKPHKKLFWRYSNGAGFAVRKGKYKLLRSEFKQQMFLFDMENDPYEQHDLSAKLPNIVNELQKEYKNWSKGTRPARWQDEHLVNCGKIEKVRQKYLDKASVGETKSSKTKQ